MKNGRYIFTSGQATQQKEQRRISNSIISPAKHTTCSLTGFSFYKYFFPFQRLSCSHIQLLTNNLSFHFKILSISSRIIHFPFCHCCREFVFNFFLSVLSEPSYSLAFSIFSLISLTWSAVKRPNFVHYE